MPVGLSTAWPFAALYVEVMNVSAPSWYTSECRNISWKVHA